jgi:hypothetical protein
MKHGGGVTQLQSKPYSWVGFAIASWQSAILADCSQLFLHLREHLFCMTIRLHVLEDVRDLAVGRDEESRSRDAHHFLAVHVFLLDDAELLRDFLLGVGEQGVRQIVFFFKLLLSGRRIGRDPQNDQSGLLQLAVCVAEPARFDGSARSVGLGIEEQHHVVAAELGERSRVSVLVGQSEVGSFRFDFHVALSIPQIAESRHCGDRRPFAVRDWFSPTSRPHRTSASRRRPEPDAKEARQARPARHRRGRVPA